MWLLSPLRGLLGYVVAGVGALVALFAWGQSKKSEGRRQAENEQLKKTAEIKRKQDAVKRSDPSDLDDTLNGL